MPRAITKFRQGDITRAIRGAKAAGIDCGPVVIRPDGCIVISPKGSDDKEGSDPLSSWEAEYRRAGKA